ncbi:MFS transporter [Mycolicibacterium fluoranthenivorans]|uniref:MFS transporter n=1 Tax=Mycolicibacterium fluoranthenivorans TaxID=258505 RepID=A0A7G8PG09_9MYCO|nr:MFS transporter [Mycolicibacterium fluoranthenivorans]QNJ93275.1 MFS transporter [Mycolicibacterium fluoranthenivorans]
MSALSIAFGVGSAIGLMILGVVVRRTSQEWVPTAGLVVMVVGLGITAALPTVVAALGGFTLVGAGFVMTLTVATSLVQERTPDHLRGRIMAFWLLSFVGARPVTALCIGPLADATSPGVAIGAVAGVLAVAAVACQPRRLRPAASSSDSGTSSASR